MKDFTDELVNLIIEDQRKHLDEGMEKVTKCISVDFTKKTFKLLDEYYDTYIPKHYVRVYGEKRKLRTKSGTTARKPRGGQISLHAAVTRGGEENAIIGVFGGDYYSGYVGGVVFDEDNFKDSGMKHIGKGISEWNILENFLFAGTGVNSDMEPLKGDIRSHIDYSYSSADLELMNYMNTYGPTLEKYFKQYI